MPEDRTSLLFVTPAHLRYDLSEACFAHRAWCIEEMRAFGVDAQCVVVADDHNLELARAHGFETVERDNLWLGRRWNDGYEFAGERGFDWVAPIGSDSWVHPSFFEGLRAPAVMGDRVCLTGKHYVLVDERAGRLGQLSIKVAGGVGPNVLQTEMLRPSGFRPVREQIPRGCDGSLLRSVREGGEIRWRWVDADPLQYVGFRTEGEQLNPYDLLFDKYGVHESEEPWLELVGLHPVRFVDFAAAVYANRLAVV